MKKIYFQEEQNFNQPWIWLLLVSCFLISLMIILTSMYVDVKSGEDSLSSSDNLIGLLIFILTFSFVFWLIIKMKLEVKVTDEEIIYRFKPIIFKEKVISKNLIESYEVRKYNAIREYRGYGIRMGFRKWGKAFNVSGNIGMQLYLKGGKKILFGTQRPDAFKHAMDKMMGKT